MNIQGKKFGFLGDSITEGIGTTSVENIYHQLLKEKCGTASAINYGISGTRIAKQTNPSQEPSWDKNFVSRVDDMDSDLDVIVIFGGTNDYGHGDAALGSFYDRSEDTFYGALHLLSKKLIEKYRGSLIMFMTPLYRFDEMEYISKPDGKYLLKDYVNAICEVAQHYSLPVLNLHSVSVMSTDVKDQSSTFFTDGVHPTDKGHKWIAKRLEGFLNTL